MTDSKAARSSNVAICVATGILVILDVLLAAVAASVWAAHSNGHLTTTEAASFAVVGVSAVVGAVTLLVIMVALLRGSRAHSAARFAGTLAWMRATLLAVFLVILAVRIGTAAIVGMVATAGTLIAVVDAVIGWYVARVAIRRTRPA